MAYINSIFYKDQKASQAEILLPDVVNLQKAYLASTNANTQWIYFTT